MEQANPGDIVALASGGPDMTVLHVVSSDAGPIVALGWFTAVGEYRTGELPLRVLVERRKAGRAGCPGCATGSPHTCRGTGEAADVAVDARSHLAELEKNLAAEKRRR